MLSPPDVEVDPGTGPGADARVDVSPDRAAHTGPGADASLGVAPPGVGDGPDVDTVWRTARTAVPDGLDRDGCRAHLADLARLRAWVDAAEVRAARRVRQLAAEGKAEPVESALGRHSGRSGRDARAAAEREQACDEMPGFETALDTGAVSAGHIDALASAANSLRDDELRAEFTAHETELLCHAADESVDTFTRRCRLLARRLVAAHSGRSDADELDGQRKSSTVKRWVDKITGMHHTHLALDPVRDQALWTAINAQLGRLRNQNQTSGPRRTSWAQLQVDAVVAAVSAGNGSTRVPEIGILIDYTTLAADAAAGGLCTVDESGLCETLDGTLLPVSTVRRMCCDAAIYPIVLGGDGRPLDAGRTQRTATADQRRALAAMYASCGSPDCGVGFDACRIHHIDHWIEHHGPTDLENLIPLCDNDHHLVHEGGWTLTMTPDRVTTWYLPDGTIHHKGLSTNRRQDPT